MTPDQELEAIMYYLDMEAYDHRRAAADFSGRNSVAMKLETALAQRIDRLCAAIRAGEHIKLWEET